MPYPHHDAEFLIAVAVVIIVGGLLLPLTRMLDPRIGVPLAALPLVALVVVCIVFYRRTHSKD